MVRLLAHPGETVEWEGFKQVPAPAVALDGYVAGVTRVRATHASFDHHAGVDRLVARSTCEQVALALRFGPPEVLRSPDRLNAHINHADEDVCLSVWLLRNQGRTEEPAVRKLVEVEGILDTTGGCVAPTSSLEYLRELGWTFAPCATRPRTVDEMLEVAAEVENRIDRLLDGTAGRVDLTAGYELIDRRGRVAAIAEHGVLSRIGLHDEDIDVFVSVRNGDGRCEMSIGKTSPYAPYDLATAMRQLSELDPNGEWGGGEMIGGSPRHRGTGLDVDTVLDIVERSRSHATGPMLVHPTG